MCFASYKTKVKTGLSTLWERKKALQWVFRRWETRKEVIWKSLRCSLLLRILAFTNPTQKEFMLLGRRELLLSRLGHMLEIMAISLASTHGIHYNHTNKLKLDYLRSLFKALIYFSTFHASFSKSAFICHTISKPKFLSEILIQFQTFEFSCTKCRF